MAAASKLIVFNDALRELGSQPLANLSTANTRLSELNGAFDHAVEYMLSKLDWGFTRRRATLTGVFDNALPPYSYRYTKPTDYLRKCWVKASAADTQQIDHAEVGVAHGFKPTKTKAPPIAVAKKFVKEDQKKKRRRTIAEGD